MPSNADQAERFVLDACALIAYLNDEPGADGVADLLDHAQQDRIQLFVAAVNVHEVFYDCLKRDAAKASQLIADVYSLPVTVIEPLDRPLMAAAGWFKVAYRVSLADSLGLVLAQQLSARLVSTDHRELDPIDRDGKVLFRWLR